MVLSRRDLIRSAAGAATLAAIPHVARGATTKPVVRLGYLDSFSGVFADIAAYHKAGALLALEDLNRKGRVQWELVYGDDASKPPTAVSEARRLATQENVDAIFGGISSGIGLALAPLCDQLGIFNLEIGPFDSSITGANAARLTYRYGPNARMVMRPLANRLPALGKKWYFIQADYSMGRDSYAQLSDVLKRTGGTEAGHDVLPLGTSDFSSTMTKVRNSGADVLILSNSGIDAANSIKQFVQFGLHKQMHLAGINLEDFYYNAVPLNEVAGATFTVLWAPNASDSSKRLTRRLQRDIKGPISARHFYGYGALMVLADRIQAAGSTDAEKIAAAFDDHSFDGYKGSRSVFHGCDHQCAQDVYAGAIVNSKTFERTKYMFDLIAEVPTAESDGTCDSPWARAAKTAISSSKVVPRPGYTPKIV